MSDLTEWMEGEQDGELPEAVKEMDKREQIRFSIENGNHRAEDICELTQYTKRTVRSHANDMAEEGELQRDRDEHGYFYELTPGTVGAPEDRLAGEETTMDDEATTGDAGGTMPVDRSYDWDEWTLDDDDVHEYVQTDAELEDIDAMIRTRRETDNVPHFAVSGPTGCAKTTLGMNVAAEMNAPCFTVQCGEGLRVADLLGSPTIVDDETWWADGTITKALLASQERPVVLLLDEVNRAPGRSKALLFSVLDGRCQVSLDSRGGEIIQGDPMNLIVISTMNKGANYMVNNIDDAEKRRLGPEWQITHLGMSHPGKEADLIADRTPVGPALATRLVEVANDIRERAQDSSSDVSFGTSTGLVLDWAQTAFAFSHRDNPVVAAAQRVFINPYHADDPDEEDLVSELVNKHLDGCPVDDEEVREWAGETVDGDDDPDGMLDCNACGYYENYADAEPSVTSDMTCPDCGETLRLHD